RLEVLVVRGQAGDGLRIESRGALEVRERRFALAGDGLDAGEVEPAFPGVRVRVDTRLHLRPGALEVACALPADGDERVLPRGRRVRLTGFRPDAQHRRPGLGRHGSAQRARQAVDECPGRGVVLLAVEL